ncbi:VOC family protein [Streptomyces yaizuensis]|uniref:VOC family protein n=1 Tax=Streptomyces yaizuensis TaxID=2989713 RepID=A0ABQ5P2V6_9ACTN|nr:VOC family protein [Streptomyces sp. YSPA8]GLF96942.1 VOC family protein [Streptomyces sp. YSPA8]
MPGTGVPPQSPRPSQGPPSPESPRCTLRSVVLDCPDAHRLAAFYGALLGWPVRASEPGWVHLRPPGGALGLSLQTEEGYEPPLWPERPGRQQKMVHLDIQVDDLAAAVRHALDLGATRPAAPEQGDPLPEQDGLRVLLDPAGHPFCLFLDAVT